MPEWGFEAFRSAVLEGTDTLPKPGQVSGDSNNGKSAEDVVTSEGDLAREILRRMTRLRRTNPLKERPKRGRKGRRRR